MNKRLLRWFLFAVGFSVVHFAFWVFIIVRDIGSSSRPGRGDVDMGILGSIVIILFLGPLTAAKSAVGYGLADRLVFAGSTRSTWYRCDSFIAGLIAGLLLFAGILVLREAWPSLSNNLFQS